MHCITVLFIEPDSKLRTHFERALALETDLLLVSRPEFFSNGHDLLEKFHCDVLLLDADRTPVTDLRTWAKVHVLLPDARIVAMTAGYDDAILEAVLAGGIHGVHRITVEPAVLCRAVRHAAQGILDSDSELIARAKRAILQPLASTQARFGGLTIDFQSQKVARWNRPIHLAPLEFKVIAYLARQPDHPVHLNELLSMVWLASPEQGGTLAQVHNCIKRLRQKIEPDVKHPRYLLSERGRGYWLQDPTLSQHAAPPADVDPSYALPFETDLLPR